MTLSGSTPRNIPTSVFGERGASDCMRFYRQCNVLIHAGKSGEGGGGAIQMQCAVRLVGERSGVEPRQAGCPYQVYGCLRNGIREYLQCSTDVTCDQQPRQERRRVVCAELAAEQAAAALEESVLYLRLRELVEAL